MAGCTATCPTSGTIIRWRRKGLGHFRFALNETTLIDGRKQPLRSVDNVRRMVEGGTRPFRSPAELLEVVMGQSLDGLSADHLRISEELDGIEERIVRDAWHSERKALNETRRRLVAIHRQMASVAGLFRHLEHAHHAELPETLADMAARTSQPRARRCIMTASSCRRAPGCCRTS